MRKPRKIWQWIIKDAILKNHTRPPTLQVKDCGIKGKGVIALEDIEEGDFITYYSGQRLQDEPDESVNDSFIFEIQLNRRKIWIDGSNTGGIARYFNDEEKNPNMTAKTFWLQGEPHPVFFARKKISAGQELVYSYGKGDYFWRKKGWHPDTPSSGRKRITFSPQSRLKTTSPKKRTRGARGCRNISKQFDNPLKSETCSGSLSENIQNSNTALGGSLVLEALDLDAAVGTSSCGKKKEIAYEGQDTKQDSQEKCYNTDMAGSIVHEALYVDAHVGTWSFETLSKPEIASNRPDNKRPRQQEGSNTIVSGSHVHETRYTDSDPVIGSFGTLSNTEIASNCSDLKRHRQQECCSTDIAGSYVHKELCVDALIGTCGFGILSNPGMVSKPPDIKRLRHQESSNTYISESHVCEALNEDAQVGSFITLSDAEITSNCIEAKLLEPQDSSTCVQPTKAKESTYRKWSDFNKLGHFQEYKPTSSELEEDLENQRDLSIESNDSELIQEMVTIEIDDPALMIYEYVTQEDHHNRSTDKLGIKKNFAEDDHSVPENSGSGIDIFPKTSPRVAECIDVERNLTTAPKKTIVFPEAIAPKSKAVKTLSKGRRPARPCLHCGIHQTRLGRHLQRKHKEEYKKLQGLSPQKRAKEIHKLRNLGIFKHNVKCAEKGQDLMRARISKSKKNSVLVICEQCKAFLGKNSFHLHDCLKSPSKGKPKAVHQTTLLKDTTDPGFQKDVLTVIRNDRIGNMVKKEPLILMCGCRLYQKIGNAKPLRRLRRTIALMRNLVKIFKKFQRQFESSEIPQVQDMFCRSNQFKLITALRQLADSHKSSAMTLSFGYSIKSACECMISHYTNNKDERNAAEAEKFLTHFRREWSTNFKKDEQEILKRRQKKSRKPIYLPNVNDVQLLVSQCLKNINLSESSIPANFCKYRRSLYVLLTIENSRRGGEVAQLTIEEANEGFEDTWLPIDPNNVNHLPGDKICFVPGKNLATLVDVCIEKNLVSKVKLMMDPEFREKVGIKAENPYVFATIGSSASYASGNHEIQNLCAEAGLSRSITATDIRHYVASKMPHKHAMTERQKTVYLSHFGHSSEVHENIYQVPPAQEALYICSLIRNVVRGTSTTTSPKTNGQESPQSGEETPYTDESLSVSSSSESDSLENVLTPKVKRKRKKKRNLSFVEPKTDIAPSIETMLVAKKHRIYQEAQRENTVNIIPKVGEKKATKNEVRKYRRWSEVDTSAVLKDFQQYFDEGEPNKGPLPGKNELTTYLKKVTLKTLDGLPKAEQIRFLKSKIFNERKKCRVNAVKPIERTK